jgi:hypothetical protein
VRTQAELAGRTIRVLDDTVIKTQDPGASRRERLRTQAAYELAERTGLFQVPGIRSFDDDRGEIVFERLQLAAFRQALSRTPRGPALIGEAGAALAAIHGRLAFPDDGYRPTADRSGLWPGREQVPLHGDYGFRNLFYAPQADRIAIIDWTNADWIGVDADLGAPEIDLAVFLVGLFHRRLLGPWPLAHRHELARYFLSTYAAAAPHGVDLDSLHAAVGAFRPAFSRMVRRRKGALHALACSHAMIDLELFVRRLSRQGLPTADATAPRAVVRAE